jgi:hypothetical protein
MGLLMLYTRPSEAFEALLVSSYAHPVMTALIYGLRYLSIPDSLYDHLVRAGIDVTIIKDEVYRQLDEMPSLAYH